MHDTTQLPVMPGDEATIVAGGPTSEIAQQLGVSTKTVRTYRARILEKMGLKSTAEIILYALQHELVPRVQG